VRAAWAPELFQRALDRVVTRHSMLRTQFYFEAERPLQLVLEHRPPTLDVRDYRDRPLESREELIRAWVLEERAKNLSVEEPWRIGVLVFREEHIQYGLCFHHSLWDGWSDSMLTSELFACYQGLLQGQSPVMAAHPPGYHHYIALEQAALSAPQHREYWAQALADARLPRWSTCTKQRVKKFLCPISPEMSAAMMALTNELGVQEKSVWCAVYLALIALLDGGDSILGSVVVHCRPEFAQADKTIGLFLNMLPIHLKVRGCTWAEFIVRVDERLQELQQHRYYPLAQIEAELKLDFSASLFNFVNFHLLSESAEQSKVQGVGNFGLDDTNYLFEVDVVKDEVARRHAFRVSLDPEIFDSDCQARIHRHVEHITAAMTCDRLEKLIDWGDQKSAPNTL
jgi:Condensation domain